MKFKITIFVLLALWLSAASGLAQTQQHNRLMASIDKTDEMLNRAKEVVMESGSERARNQLEMAVRLQNMARTMMNMYMVDEELNALRAGKYTLSAREKAQRAIAITRQATENEDHVRRRLEKTDDIILRIEDEAGDEIPPGLRTILDSAKEKQQRAKELFRNRRLKASLQMTLQVEKTLKKAADQVGGYQKAIRQYKSQMNRYFSLRERVELSGHADRSEIMVALQNAERFQNRADDLALDGRYVKAEKEMAHAVEILTRVAEGLREPMKIQSALEGLRNQAETIREKIAEYGDEEDRRQFQDAVRHLEKAGASYEKGDFEAAAAQLQAGRQLLSRISKKLGNSASIDKIISDLKRKVEELGEKVSLSGDEQIKQEFASARENLSKAVSLYQSQEFDAAKSQLEMAYHKLSWIARALGE
jgi:hypothetical protein